jgi:creatinine amidohydrolase
MAIPIDFYTLNRNQLRAAMPETLVVLPLGATEQHGPHLPVGTDWLAVDHIAHAAADQAQAEIPVLVAPALPFGCSHHHLPFGGTLSFSTETYYRLLSELVESLITSGARRLFLLNGHGGNHELAQLVARDLALKHSVSIAASSYWTVAWEALLAAGATSAGRLAGHAGVFETSLLLALRSELVADQRPHRDSFAPTDPRGANGPYRAEHHDSWLHIDGYTDSPDRATAEQGHRYLKAIVPAVAQALVAFYRSAQTMQDDR